MRKLSNKKINLLFFLFALVTASIACNFPVAVEVIGEAVSQKCETVDRETYVLAAEKLGQTPETPSDPNSAVYEVCYEVNSKILRNQNPDPISARMYEGNKQEENPGAAPEGNTQPGVDGSDGEKGSVPAGTYIGVNPEPRGDWETVEDKFIIEIAEDGIVSGTRVYIIKRDSVGPNCTVHFENGHSQTFSGYITGASGLVTVTNESFDIWDDSGCPEGSYKINNTDFVCDLSPITITGNQLEIVSKASDGNSLCGGVFQATKK